MESPLVPFIGKRSPRILVVDDDPVNLQVVSLHLKRWRCIVETATNGAQARAKVRKFNPDLIVLDVVMPDQSGFAVSEALQADPATSHIPIIFLTALTGIEAKVIGFDTGGHDYVTKPFNAGELAARVGARLRHKYAEDTLRARHAELSSQAVVARERDPSGENQS